jgi:PAS domain S-box-containing protein
VERELRIPFSLARSAQRVSQFVDTRRARLMLAIARGTATATMVLALAALLGFATKNQSLASLAPGRITMKPNTAIATFALGVAVRSLASRSFGTRRQIGRIAALIALMIATTSLVERAFDWNPGIDQVVLSDPWTDPASTVPGRPSVVTVSGLILLAGAVLLADAMLAHTLVQGMAIAAGSIGGLALIGYAVDAEALYGIRPYASLGPATALSLLLLAMGTLAAVPERGVASLVAADSVGGALTRRLVPIAVGVPFVLVGAAQAAAEHGFVRGEIATAMLVVSLAAVMGAVVLHAAGSIHRLDGMRSRGDAMLRDATSRVRHLSAVLDASSIPIVSFDGLGRVVTWNPAAERAFGRRASTTVGRRTSEVFPAETARAVANALEPVLRRGEARRIDVAIERADGTRLAAVLAIAPLVDWERRVAGACAVLHEQPAASAPTERSA